MKVLIGCEESGTIREEFRKLGHNAWSCDLKPSRLPGKHLQCNLLDILGNGWDLAILHPPCTLLAVSGARWFDDPRYPNRRKEQEEAVRFFMACWNAPILKLAIENPVGIMSTRFREPDQYIDPTQFGHSQSKKTGLWLRNLPKLVFTPDMLLRCPVVDKPVDYEHISFGHHMPRTPDRGAKRSVTFRNIAWAMAEQWGGKIN